MRMSRFVVCVFLISLVWPGGRASANPVIAQNPALSKDKIAFTMGGEIWLTGRDGGQAFRITTNAEAPLTGGNAFSPDGKLLAFTAKYGGAANVYVIPVSGGAPRRLTFDGVADDVIGWNREGTRILFRSTRHTFYPDYGLPRVYSVGLDGGRPEALPFPVAYNVAYAAGQNLAAVETQQLVNESWKQYRGGDQRRILIVDPATLAQGSIPGPSGNDYDPMWVKGRLYFLSDREGPTTLYVYDRKAGTVTRQLDPDAWDLKDASLGPGGIVISQLGQISVFNLSTHKLQHLEITPVGDIPGAAPRAVDLSDQIVDVAVSDTGAMAFEARGHIIVIDPKKHLWIYGASDYAERSPSFQSPGRLAVFSDRSGKYQLISYELDTRSKNDVVHFQQSAYYFAPTWSPDGKRLAYMDGKGSLWVVRPGRAPTKIDRMAAVYLWFDWDAAWSADGTKLAYSRLLPNGLSAIFVWSAVDGHVHQVTPSDVAANHPAWDADGQRLWFVASNNTPPSQAYLGQIDKLDRSWTAGIFWTRFDGTQWTKPKRLTVPARRYEGLIPEKQPGKLLILETVTSPDSFNFSSKPTQTLQFIDADAPHPTVKTLISGISGFGAADFYGRFQTTFRASSDHTQFVYRKGQDWTLARINDGRVENKRPLSLKDATVTVNPRAEWRQMFDESFRELEYFFHDATRTRPDFAAWKKRYEPLVPAIWSRQDLTYVLNDVAGDLHMSHAGASTPATDSGVHPRPATGMLGVDVSVEGDRYSIVRIYHSPMFGAHNPAPLDDPDLSARPGDSIVSINGKSVNTKHALAEYLQGTADRPTKLCLASGAGKDRCATIVPIANDTPLRFAAWVHGRWELVDRLSGGCLGYFHMSDTLEPGMIQFNQQLYAQHDRKGFIVDARYNGGGYAADYFIQSLTAKLMGKWLMAEAQTMTTPGLWLDGPKAMVINAYCGSGCDTFAYFFKSQHVGPLIGSPTWGGVSGSGNLPMLIDGTYFSVPAYTFLDPQGRYALEGHAVQPTIPVQEILKDMAAGRDAQLVRAVSVLMKKIGSTHSCKNALRQASPGSGEVSANR